MRQKLFLSLAMLFCTFSACAQEHAVRFQKEVKLNLNFKAQSEGFSIGEPAPVYILENRRQQRHEFELSKIGFRHDSPEVPGSDGKVYQDLIRKYRLWLRYQFTYPLLNEALFVPYLAGALQSRWQYNHFKSGQYFSLPSLAYPGPIEYYSNRHDQILEIIPGVRWTASDRLGIDFSLVLPVLQHQFIYKRNINPALPISAQRHISNEFNSNPFRGFHSRLGIYVKL